MDITIKTTQQPHQAEDYLRFRDMSYFALFLEMGLGKTKIVLDIASHRFITSKTIDGLLVIAPKSVYLNWQGEEIPKHLAVPYVCLTYHTGTAHTVRQRIRADAMLDDSWAIDKIKILVMSYDSLRTEHGERLAKSFAKKYRTMMVLDESTAISSHTARRTRSCKRVGKLCHVRCICTGTPSSETPFDLHSPLQFLEESFWKNLGLGSFSVFKQEFALWDEKHGAGGRKFPHLREYRRLDQLNKLIEPVSSRRLKESTLDLPPKIYVTRRFELHEKQRELYDTLREDFQAELDSGQRIEAAMAIVRLTKLQQIACGHVSAVAPTDDADLRALISQTQTDDAQTSIDDLLFEKGQEDDSEYTASLSSVTPVINEYVANPCPGCGATVECGSGCPIYGLGGSAHTIKIPVEKREVVDIVPPEDNPRLQLLLETIDQVRVGKIIVWCRFRRDVETVMNALPGTAVRYDGSTSSQDRAAALTAFRDPAHVVRVFVANTAAISMGVTLTIAKTMIYYSNSFSLEKRLQSEDRNHRIGQDQSVTIIDLIADDTVDEHLVKTLREKFETAATVMGDRLRDWLSASSAKEI